MTIVSVLVCTRNRPDSLPRAVRSLLVNGEDALELIVIDQSEGPESEQALQGFRVDPRLRYVRAGVRGKGAALNEGLRLARGEIVVCTDDDCEAPPGWPVAMAGMLDRRPTAAVLFCNVTAPDCDWDTGYIPTYVRRRDKVLRSLLATCSGHGMGAGMALRRDVMLALGGFDEQIGPGARFPSGDDWDIAHRALLKGWEVYETADLSILHHGFRTLAEGRDHARRDWLAIGAVCAKPLRAGHLSAVVLALWYFSVHTLWPPFHDVLRLRQPRGRSRIAGFVSGFVQGLRTAVDRETLLFRPPA
jgi:glycosyltransferase involved in cell wall biosynthesis